VAWTFLQMQDKVLGWLDDTGDNDRMRTMCKQVLNDAQLARATEYPWSFMIKTVAGIAPITAGSGLYSLPADFYRPLVCWDVGGQRMMTEVPPRSFEVIGANPALTIGAGYLSGVYRPFIYRRGQAVVEGVLVNNIFVQCLDEGQTYPASINVSYYAVPSELSADADLSVFPFPHEQLLVYDAVLDLKTYASESIDLIPLIARKRDDALRRLYESQKAAQTTGAFGGYVHLDDTLLVPDPRYT